MPTYSIQGPDGRTYSIDGPEGATREQVIAAIQARLDAQQPQQAAQPQELPEETGLYGVFRSAADLPVQFARGTVGAVQMIASAFGADNPVAQTLNSVDDVLEDLLSAGAKNDQAKIAQIMAEAEDQGIGANIVAALKAIQTAPLDSIAQAFGSMAPIIAGSAASSVLGATALGVRAAGAGIGAVMGAGGVKSGIYDEVKNALVNNGFSEEDAEQRAEAAQSYASENLPQILVGGALGTVDALTGAEAGIVRKFLSREIGEEGADTAARETIKKGAARRVTEGFAAEALPEAAQGAQQQLATNLALQNEGFDVPTMRGVAGAGALEGIIGGLTGAVVGAVPERAAPTPPAPAAPVTPETPPPPPPGAAPPAGPPAPPAPPAMESDLDVMERMEVPAADSSSVLVGGRARAADVMAADEEVAAQEAKASKTDEALPVDLLIRDKILEIGQEKMAAGKDPVVNALHVKNKVNKQLREAGLPTLQDNSRVNTVLGTLAKAQTVEPIRKGNFLTYRIKVPNASEAGVGADQVGQGGVSVTPPTGGRSAVPVSQQSAQGQEVAGTPTGGVAGASVSAGQADVGAGAGTDTVITQPPVKKTRKQVAPTVSVTPPPATAITPPATAITPPATAITPPATAITPSAAATPPPAETEVVTESPKKRGRPKKVIDTAPIAEPVAAEGIVTPEAEYNSLLRRIQGAQVAAATQNQSDRAKLQQHINVPLGQRGRDYGVVGERLRNNALRSASNIRDLQAQLETLVKSGKPGVQGADAVRANIEQKVGLVADVLGARYASSADQTQQLRAQEAIALQRAQKRMVTEKENEAGRLEAERLLRVQQEEVDTQEAAKAVVAEEAQGQKSATDVEDRTAKKVKEILNTKAELIDAASKGDINEVLGILHSADTLVGVKTQYRKAFNLVTRELQKIDFTGTNVVFENKADPKKTLSPGRDAQYDPATNTILLSAKGATNSAVIQHELIHAATVKIIRDYQDAEARKELSSSQREGVEHLMRIFDFVKKQKTTNGKPFTEYFSYAMENVYEFVAYGMMEPAFQKELAQLHSQNLRPQGKGGKNIWKQFMDAVASVLGIADKEGNVLAELSGAFRQILASPLAVTTDVVQGVPVLGARRRRREPARVQAPPETTPPATPDAMRQATLEQLEPKDKKVFDMKEWFRYWFISREGVKRFIQDYADVTRPLVEKRREMDLERRLVMTGPNTNDISGLIDAAPSLLEMKIKAVDPVVDRLRGRIQELSERSGRTFKDELARLSTYFKAETVKQRRIVKYMMAVPLSTKRNLRLRDGKVVSAADLRMMIYDKVMKPEVLTDAERDGYNKMLQDLVFSDVEAKTPSKYVDPMGFTTQDYLRSRQDDTYTPSAARPVEFNDAVYDIIYGTPNSPRWDTAVVDQLLAELRDEPHQELIRQIRDDMMELDKYTREYNAESGFLSVPAQNFIKFYGWDKYVPLKGKPNERGELTTVGDLDDMFFDNGANYGAAYRLDYVGTAEGRGSEPDDPILRTITDARAAAARSSRAGVMSALENLIKSGDITGSIKKEPITFRERHYKMVNLDRLRGDNLFFDYKKNGDIVIMKVDDPKIIRALRPEFHPNSAFWRYADKFNSAMASGHTRYNIKFAIYDFVRNVFFNSQAIFKKYGAQFGQKYFINVARAVFSENRLRSSAKISKAYHDNNLDELKRLSETDPFFKAANEYLINGGRVAFVQSYQSSKQLDEELDRVTKGPTPYDTFMNKARYWADRWSDMFENVARIEAYRISKDYNLNVRNMTEEDAIREAVYMTKNLTNFQKRGGSLASKRINAAFMFMSPAMTGAVAAYDVLRDGFITDLDKEFNNETKWPEKLNKALAAVEAVRRKKGTDEEKAASLKKAQEKYDEVKAAHDKAKAEFVKNLAPQVKNARQLMWVMFGAGVVLYVMARAAAGDDDEGRNQVLIDDKALWTRNARLPTTFLTGDPDSRPINIPWGFGPGALAAAGAQLAALGDNAINGDADVMGATGNIVNIMTDSFMPIPAARYNPMDDFGAWFFTTISPSVLRPGLEYALNVDSLGREIYRENYSRYGAAFSGSDNMQNAYKDLAAFVMEKTNGEVQLDPAIIRHFTSAYFDAIGSYAADATDLVSLAMGRRNFDWKQDTIIFDSFVGAKTSYDARRFAEVTQGIEKKREKMNAAINSPSPDVFINYQMNNQKDQFMIDTYDQYVSEINEVRNIMKQIRAAGMEPKDRDAMLKDLRDYRDSLMGHVTDRLEEAEQIFEN